MRSATWFAAGCAFASLAWSLVICPHAHADMCGPVVGLPSYSNGWVHSCEPWVPFAGNLPHIPVPVAQGGAQAPLPVIGGLGGWGGQTWTP